MKRTLPFLASAALACLACCSPSPIYLSGYQPPPDRDTTSAPARKDETGVPSPSGEWPLMTYQGLASYYGKEFHGRKTACGELFDMNAMTAAHKTLPFGTIVRVTNPANSRSVNVRINDRGPFVGERIIDLSYAAAKAIDMLSVGTVKIEVLSLPAKKGNK